ncbi:hypothetical protein A3A76_00335 [Candidatus Woesebacteria bacterium RIFCSPLOWO2_01_FULL_39_23]|nr:MAG: hypothetical protein A3A76_00335 [Candidatus Woesebacteria bacterium RIFCSPLOWO2_01_FULL_39_23]
MRPVLSIVMPARNDNYMGNSNWRLETALDFLAIELDKLNKLKDVEVIIVDWGSKVPLHTVLTLNEKADSIARFILVSDSVINTIKIDSDFPAVIAANVGIRRAWGNFIALSPADILFTRRFFKRLFDILHGESDVGAPADKSLFVFSRKDIPTHITDQNLSISDLSKYIAENDKKILPISLHPYYLTPASVLMMHRNLWFASHAFDENLIHWGWSDIDLCLRMRLRHFITDMSKEDVMCLYHLNHYTQGFTRTKMSYPSINPFVVNNKRWGLADYTLEEVSKVPKTVDLDISSMPVDITYETSDANKYFRVRHLVNLIEFFLKNANIGNLKLVFSHSAIILFQYPFMKKIFPLLKRIKRSPVQQ